MTIAKRLHFAATCLQVLAISVVSARAADEAKDPDTVWIVKRTGGTIQMLPVSEDAMQPLLKKQAKNETANRADAAKSDHPLPLPEADGGIDWPGAEALIAARLRACRNGIATEHGGQFAATHFTVQRTLGERHGPFDVFATMNRFLSALPFRGRRRPIPARVMEMERPSSRMTDGAVGQLRRFSHRPANEGAAKCINAPSHRADRSRRTSSSVG